MPFHLHKCETKGCGYIWGHNLNNDRISDTNYDLHHTCPNCSQLQRRRYFTTKLDEIFFHTFVIQEELDLLNKYVENGDFIQLILLQMKHEEGNLDDYRKIVTSKLINHCCEELKYGDFNNLNQEQKLTVKKFAAALAEIEYNKWYDSPLKKRRNFDIFYGELINKDEGFIAGKED